MIPGHYRYFPPMAMDRLADYSAALYSDDVNVLDFGKGVSSFNPFSHVPLQLSAAELETCLGYGDINGLWTLRELIARYYSERFGYDLSPKRVCITTGASSALTIAFTMLLQKDSEIIVPATHFPVYRVLADIFGARCRFAPLNARMALDVDRLPALITARTRAIVVNSPSNPFGAVSTGEELAAIASLSVPVIFDEVYQALPLTEQDVPSAIRHADQHILINSCSKSLAIAGVRIGYLIVPEESVELVTNIKAAVSMSTSLPSQLVALALFRERERLWAAHRQMLQQHWKLFRETAHGLGLRLLSEPLAGFFAAVDISDLGMDPMTVALGLVRHAALITVPGNDFGGRLPHFLRMSFACRRESIAPGLARLAAALYNARDTFGASERSGLSWQGRPGLTVLSAI